MSRPLPSTAQRKPPAGGWQPYYEPHEHTHLPGGRDPLSGTGGYAQKGESFITAEAEANLDAERVLAVDTGLTLTDNGANSTIVIGLDEDNQPLEAEEDDGTPNVPNIVRLLVPSGSLSSPTAGTALIDMRIVYTWFDATDLTDGARTNFDLPDFYESGTIRAYLNGARLRPVTDYTEDANLDAITLGVAPASDDELIIDYQAAEL